ncbi:MAG: hypothetical protein HYV75_04680 [Opitutae bacterium]|nr:hypothetical protein [Opitutae bacterium]
MTPLLIRNVRLVEPGKHIRAGDVLVRTFTPTASRATITKPAPTPCARPPGNWAASA